MDIVKFIEDYHEIKLTTYQKLYVKALASKDNIMIDPRSRHKKLTYNLMIEYNKALRKNFDVVTPNGIEEYRNGELIGVTKIKK